MHIRVGRLFIVILAAILVLSIAAIAPPTAAQAGARKFTIGSMIWNTTIPFYTNLIKGEQDAGKKYGITVIIRNGEAELAKEIAVVQQYVAQKVDLILVSPSNPEGIIPAVKRANAAGIPVIQVNSTVGKGAQTVTYVGANDFTFGERQGELLVKAIGKTGNVALILGHLGVSAQILREDGLQKYLKAYPGIKIVSKQSADWDFDKALGITQNLLTKYGKGTLQAIVSQGPEGVSGARYAAKNGRTDVKFIAGDYPKDVRDAIVQGTLYGTVNQDPYPQGYRAVELAYFWLTGQKSKVPRPNDFLPLPLVTKENVASMQPAW
jgi:ribose transport system substrate-binding protein